MMDSIADLSFSSLLDAFSDPILLIDDHGIIQQINLAAQNMTDYTNDQLQGKSIDQLIPSWHDTIHLYDQKTALKPLGNESLKSNRTKLIKQNKQGLLVDIFPKSIKIDRQLFMLLILHVVDPQHQADHHLQESEERLFLAKQAAGLGIFDLDLQQQIIYQDERMRELWGGQSNKISPYDAFYAVIHPKDRISYQIALEKATNPSGDGEFNIDVRVIHMTTGSERWIHSIGKVHFYEGIATRLIGIVQDITKQKLLEKELQSYRAEVESLFKQQVAIQTASAIAHELNQPLTVISAYSELALVTLEKNPANLDKIKQSLHNCVIQTQRAGDTLHELIASLHKIDVHIEQLDLNQVILDALRTVRSDGFSDFQQILQLELNLPAVLANRVQIKKVVVNLLRNAVEAMNSTDVATSEITISVKTMPKEKYALVTIEDKGPGIDPKIMHQIFDPFFTTKPTGIGMGLSISRALIEANGGQLWVDPHTPTGARLNFTLPFAA